MIFPTGRRIAPLTKSTSICSYRCGTSSVTARMKKSSCKRRENRRSYIGYTKAELPTRCLHCRETFLRDVKSILQYEFSKRMNFPNPVRLTPSPSTGEGRDRGDSEG